MNFLRNLDRRWVFLLMGVCVALPLLLKSSFPESRNPGAEIVFNTIENLPDGSRILLSYDYDPGSQGELMPMAMAFARHCSEKKHKMYFMCLWPLGEPMIQEAMNILRTEFPDLEYGTDYMNFGYKLGNEAVIKNTVQDLHTLFGTDYNKTSLNSIPMMKGVKTIKNMKLIINCSAGDPGTKQWIQYAATPESIPIVAGVTGVQAPQLVPYLPWPLLGQLAAIKGAAAYEQLLIDNYPKFAEPQFVNAAQSTTAAKQRMGPQFVAHLLMIALIILGNFIYFVDRRRGKA